MCENSLKTDIIEISDNETEENKESKSWKRSHSELTTVNKSQKFNAKIVQKYTALKQDTML